MLILQKAKDDSLPISYRTERMFSHPMTRCCCQPPLATNMPDIIHAAVPSSSSTPSARRARGGGQQVLPAARGLRRGPGEPWRRRWTHMAQDRPNTAPSCSRDHDPWLQPSLRTCLGSSANQPGFSLEQKRVQGAGAQLRHEWGTLGATAAAGWPTPGLKPPPRRQGSAGGAIRQSNPGSGSSVRARSCPRHGHAAGVTAPV